MSHLNARKDDWFSHTGRVESPGYFLPGDPRFEYRTVRFRVGGRLPAATLEYAVVKRIIDIVCVLALLPGLIFLMAMIGLVVRLSSPGPIFVKHRRIKQGGYFFSMWKFRTMYLESAEILDRYTTESPAERELLLATQASLSDPRITPVGQFMRRWMLDELPNFWNVLRGCMSIVGPRPMMATEVEQYGAQLAYYTSVKPGITGLWQATRRSVVDFRERVAADCDYVERWSLWLDFRIMLLTIRSIISTRGRV